ncbi:MAG: YjbE family putative metal transport protein [Alicyclobacillus sp.]|nr:YjbE family putative metal transport protein [Alicyclobacillus sp.]
MTQLILATLNIIFVNALLSADNAVVLAMIIRPLEERYRRRAMLWGSVILVILLIALTGIANWVMHIPGVKTVGAIFLGWIALKLLISKEEADPAHRHAEHQSLTKVILWIVAADLIMSLDNVVAIAAIANGHLVSMAIGLLISIPIILLGSRGVVSLLDRFPVLLWAGTAILSWTAGHVLISDQWLGRLISFPHEDLVVPLGAAAAVLAAAFVWIQVRQRAGQRESGGEHPELAESRME